MAAPVDIERELVTFAGVLRHEGVPVGTHEVTAAMDALQTLEQSEPDGFYWALRLAMVHGRDELVAFDRAFGRHWTARLPQREQEGEGQLGGESPVRRERKGAGESVARPPTATPRPPAAAAARSSPATRPSCRRPTSTRKGRTARWRCCAARTSPPTRRRTTRVSPTSSACSRSVARGGSAASAGTAAGAWTCGARSRGAYGRAGCRCGASTAARPRAAAGCSSCATCRARWPATRPPCSI